MLKHRFALLALVGVIALGCDQSPTEPGGQVETHQFSSEEIDVAAALRDAADRGLTVPAKAVAAARALTDELNATALLLEEGRPVQALGKVPRLRILIGLLADDGDVVELDLIRVVVGALENLNAQK